MVKASTDFDPLLDERPGQQRKPLTKLRSAPKAKDEPMRDFRDAKAMARTLRQTLQTKGLRLSNSEALELVAKMLGARDWNTVAAAMQAASMQTAAAKREPPESAAATIQEASPARPNRVGRLVGFAPELETTLHRAVASANRRKHQYATVEHLLLELLDDADAAAVLEACAVEAGVLRSALTSYVDDELTSLEWEGGDAAPTAGFQRVVQRAVIHVQSSGRDVVTGANLLLATLSERESRAYALLTEAGLTRFDAVHFIAHGVRKDGGKAA